jgi:subtilisin family serine protease
MLRALCQVLDAIDYATAQGTLVVFAAGNAGTEDEW